MVNQPLVDYIKQQAEGGVSADVVRKALLDAGWPEGDVSDSMTAALPAAAPSLGPQEPAAEAFDPVAAMGAASTGGVVFGGAAATEPVSKERFFDDSHLEEHHRPAASRIAMLVMGALIIVLGGTLAYIYLSLNGKLSLAAGESATNANQASTLRSQAQKLAEEKNELAGRVQTLSGEREALMEEVMFFAVSATATSSEAAAAIRGTITAANGVYTLTTPHNIRITVKNSKDVRVDGGLKPLIGSTATLTGTRRPGLAEITVTGINGDPVVAVATSTTP